MARKKKWTPLDAILSIIRIFGPKRYIEAVGFKRVFEDLGPLRLIEIFGVDRIREELTGMRKSLTPEERRLLDELTS